MEWERRMAERENGWQRGNEDSRERGNRNNGKTNAEIDRVGETQRMRKINSGALIGERSQLGENEKDR
jgi:hypothetical protein